MESGESSGHEVTVLRRLPGHSELGVSLCPSAPVPTGGLPPSGDYYKLLQVTSVQFHVATTSLLGPVRICERFRRYGSHSHCLNH